jgi:hypothetical protein
VLWKRDLGEGYSSVLVENGVVYTMYGRPGEEVALAASDGKGDLGALEPRLVSQRRSRSRQWPARDAADRGRPHVHHRCDRPLRMSRQEDGKLLWTHALWDEQHGSRLIYGYASSPLAYRDLVLLPLGGAGRAMAAFRQSDGSVAWKKDDAGTTANPHSEDSRRRPRPS